MTRGNKVVVPTQFTSQYLLRPLQPQAREVQCADEEEQALP